VKKQCDSDERVIKINDVSYSEFFYTGASSNMFFSGVLAGMKGVGLYLILMKMYILTARNLKRSEI
jgi:hypothetical protein